ncbi:hypothetical protein ACF8Q9_09435, partial [Pseudomonas sp. TYF_15]|uniref:hypothetical protein n=1 Tax=Pseudomonas sp. TYF_15 TaxID=3367194 RepID=UPI00370C22A1
MLVLLGVRAPGRGLKGICAWLEGNSSEARLFLKILFKHFYITKIRSRFCRRQNTSVEAGVPANAAVNPP